MAELSLPQQAQALLDAFESGAVFAYPTEAVYGLGCDPDNQAAVLKILHIKQRPVEKGMILVADSYERVRPFINENALAPDVKQQIIASWPGHNTWLMPKSQRTADWVSGDSDKVAIRVSEHPLIAKICQVVGKPIISTSANPAGEDPAVSQQQVQEYFGHELMIVAGQLGGAERPSVIRDGISGKVIRD